MSTKYPELPFTTFPNTVQTFTTMTNILASDGALIKNFQEAMQAGNANLAQQYYRQITNADAKFITAEKMNTLLQTCVALEKFYSTDVQPYITAKQTEWQNIINQFDYMGVYASGTQYVKNNWVSYTTQGVKQLYICIQQPPVGTAPTNTTYWRVLSIVGQRGESGDGLTFMGDWNSATTYSVQDAVSYDNALWGCTQANTNVVPEEGSSYWNLIYRSQPTVYPVQANQPATASVGDLWFEVLT